MRRGDESDEKKVVEAFFSEEEAAGFRELESLIASAKPEFGKEWEEKLLETMKRKKRRNLFYFRALAAAFLLIASLTASLFFFNSGFSEKPSAPAAVSSELVAELVSSFDGNVDPGMEELFAAAEEKLAAGSTHMDSYIEDVVGGDDENDIS
ncbi:MAG TPA: hypothetical protein PK747_11345 [Acidobacteriota bacterium]|nr:hypothetical protein [Acidobacteriota bacterium]